MIYTEPMQTSRRAAQIAKLKKRRQELAAKARDADKRLADRLRQLQTHEAKTERKRETRRKIIIGAIVRAAQISQTDISLGWLEEQIQALTRPDDRALFGLDAEPSADAADSDKTEPAGGRRLRRSPPGRRTCWPNSSRSIRSSRGSSASTPTSPSWKSSARRRRPP